MNAGPPGRFALGQEGPLACGSRLPEPRLSMTSATPPSRVLLGRLLATGAVACLMLWLWFDPHNRPNFSDFKVYWVAGEKAAAHRTVYDVVGHFQYKYSPFVALLWGIPHVLPGQRYHWAALHYAACGLGFVALWFALAYVTDRTRSFALWLVTLAVFGVGLRDELKLGQANLWPFLLVLPAWFVGPRPRPRAPAHDQPARGVDWQGLLIGACWGFAIQWKLYALILGPLWLLRRRMAIWVGAAGFTLLTLGGALAVAHGPSFAWHENLSWLQSLLLSSEELVVSRFNVSTLGILGKWSRHLGVPDRPWAQLAWAGLLFAWVVTLFWAEREAQRRDDRFMRFWAASWAWAWIVVLNPLVWPYWLLFCIPLFLAYVQEATRDRRALLDLAFIAVCGVFSAANWLQNTKSVHEGVSWIAALILFFDAQRRVRGRMRPATDVDEADEVSLPIPLTQRPS